MVSSGIVSKISLVYKKAHNWCFLSTDTTYAISCLLGRTGRSSWLFWYLLSACFSTHPPTSSECLCILLQKGCVPPTSLPTLNTMWQHLGHHR